MPSPRAILADILAQKLDPTKSYRHTNSRGQLKVEKNLGVHEPLAVEEPMPVTQAEEPAMVIEAAHEPQPEQVVTEVEPEAVEPVSPTVQQKKRGKKLHR